MVLRGKKSTTGTTGHAVVLFMGNALNWLVSLKKRTTGTAMAPRGTPMALPVVPVVVVVQQIVFVEKKYHGRLAVVLPWYFLRFRSAEALR